MLVLGAEIATGYQHEDWIENYHQDTKMRRPPCTNNEQTFTGLLFLSIVCLFNFVMCRPGSGYIHTHDETHKFATRKCLFGL